MSLPPLRVDEIGTIQVVRDDLVPGGTKRRVLDSLLTGADEFVYATPAQGYAQVALAHACRAAGKRATIFVAKRAILHKRTDEARLLGARICQVPYGYLSNVQAKARAYADMAGATLLPFGLDTPAFLAALADLGRMLPSPAEVWTVAGSGVLTRGLQQAWPHARFFAVQIGKPPHVGRATVLRVPERSEQNARRPPPFPSCSNYDAKAWAFICQHAAPGALFWNVAA